MTKPVVVEKIEQSPGVLHVDTKAWTKGPCAEAPEPQAGSAVRKPAAPAPAQDEATEKK